MQLLLQMTSARSTLVFQPVYYFHFASELDIETFGGAAPVAAVHPAIAALVLQIPAEVPFPALSLLRFPLSSETGHSWREMTARFPRCTPARLSLAPRSHGSAVRPSFHHPG